LAKKVKQITIGTLLVLLVSLFIVSALLVFRPVRITRSLIRLEPFIQGEVQPQKDIYYRYADNPGDNQIIRAEPAFPSDDPNEYCHILIFFELKNLAPFSAFIEDGRIKNPNEAEFVIYKRPTAVSTSLPQIQSNISEDCFHLFCYRGKMTDEELISKVKNLDFTIFFGTKFLNSLHMNHSLKKAEVITQEELEAIRQKYE
jgi:hypothetical protein